ncbi:hypothetical protein vBKpnAMK6_00468 [Klebsiella phage vB_Kpn_AM_K6]
MPPVIIKSSCEDASPGIIYIKRSHCVRSSSIKPGAMGVIRSPSITTRCVGSEHCTTKSISVKLSKVIPIEEPIRSIDVLNFARESKGLPLYDLSVWEALALHTGDWHLGVRNDDPWVQDVQRHGIQQAIEYSKENEITTWIQYVLNDSFNSMLFGIINMLLNSVSLYILYPRVICADT